MNWHDTFIQTPSPQPPGQVYGFEADPIDATSDNNTASTYVFTKSSNGPCDDRQSGTASSRVGAELYIDGSMGRSSQGKITINYSYSTECFSNAGLGFSGMWFPINQNEVIVNCNCSGSPNNTVEIPSYDKSSNETIPFFFEEGQTYNIGLLLTSHADACTGEAYSSLSATINSIKVEFLLAPVPDPSVLWPPNHKMVNVSINAMAYDRNGFPMVLNSATVISNEPVTSNEDGDLSPDWTEPVINQATGIITLKLRAERLGKGNGREYSISITATEKSGNINNAIVKVLVPHDQSKK